MGYRDIISRPDVTAYLYVTVQGVAEAWTPVGETRSFTGHTIKPVISSKSIRMQYGRIQPFQGVATPGSLSLDLIESGGYLSALLSDGIETILTADVSSTEVAEINVASTAAHPAAGTIDIHREAIQYLAKTATKFQTLTRSMNDDTYTPAHSMTVPTGLESDGIEDDVRVGSTPGSLDGRWIKLGLACLDPGGFPIYDSDGAFYWEIWRGIITACSPSPDAVGYSLQAETIERAITRDPPVYGVYGKLITGAWATEFGAGGAAPWAPYEEPIWIPYGRRHVGINVESPGTGCQEGTCMINLLSAGVGNWMTHGQIAKAIRDGLDAYTHPDLTWKVKCYMGVVGQPVEVDGKVTYVLDGSHELAIFCSPIEPWPYADGEIWLTVVPSPGDAWPTLGFVGIQSCHQWVYNGSNVVGFGFGADELPSNLWIQSDDTELPIISQGPATPTAGWVKIGDEVVAYTNIDTSQFLDGLQCLILTGCSRGYGGTVASEYRHVSGSDSGVEMPTVTPAYCIGGGSAGIGSQEPDASVWISALKALTGVAGVASNGTWSAWPGLGIATEFLDVAGMTALANLPPLAGPMYGSIEDMRGYLSDAIALEGYCLVTRPIGAGCLLTPVRTGMAGLDEDSISLTIDASGGVRVHGGLGAVINRIKIAGPKGKATYTDGNSMARYGVRQELAYSLPTADPQVGVADLAQAARRIFRLSAGKAYRTVAVAVEAAGRLIAPGDVVYLVFPNAQLTGLYRVLEAETPLRGRGLIEIQAARADGWQGGLYAPTTTIQDITGLDVTVTTGDGKWFASTAQVWGFQAGDYDTGGTGRITAIAGDVLTLDSVAGMAAGYELEYKDHGQKGTETRYIWQVAATYVWGD